MWGAFYMDMRTVLGEYFCTRYRIPFDEKCNVEYINARDLIVPSRIDLCAKIAYVKNKVEGINCSFIDELYCKHISAFTIGTCSEDGNDNKNNIEDYINTFNELIGSIQKNGVDETLSVIPVGRGNGIMDGGHRVAIAAYFDQEVPIVRIERLEPFNGLQFFRERLLEEKYLDYLAIEYCLLTEREVYMAICWPSISDSTDTAERILQEQSTVVYKKELNLSLNGMRNFVIQTYIEHDWCGNMKVGFAGAQPQITGCYGKGGKLTAFLIEAKDLECVKSIKEQIRQHYGLGNYSLHTTDNKIETIKLAKLLFNRNSIDFMNSGHPDTYPDDFARLETFKQAVLSAGLDLNDFAVDSSSVMSIYGLRKAQDLDYLSYNENSEIIEGNNINCHNAHLEYYETTLSELIFNPENFFVLYDVKFTSLERLRAFKKTRGERKDIDDLRLINSIYTPHALRQRYLKLCLSIKQRIRTLRYQFPERMVEILKKLHLFNIARAIYHLFRPDLRS